MFIEEENPFEDKKELNDNKINIKNYDSDSQSNDEYLNEENYDHQIFDKVKLHKINKTILEDKNNYRKYIEIAFHKYIFDNSQKQFEKIKKLCFLYTINH